MIFPATFIALPYSVDQNEPSRPERQLVQASSVDDLEAKAKQLYVNAFDDTDDADPFVLQFEQTEPELGSFGDFQVTFNDDNFIYLTQVKEHTELDQLKERIEGGDSCIYAYENVDLDKMRSEGDGTAADKIEVVLARVSEINRLAGVKEE